MTFKSTPSQDGIYHIKILDKQLYLDAVLESESTASDCNTTSSTASDRDTNSSTASDSTTTSTRIRLSAPDPASKTQKWRLEQVDKKTNIWHIYSCAIETDHSGLVCKKAKNLYSGHGYPYPGGSSLRWLIQEVDKLYSRISAPANGTDCFDSQFPEGGEVHFWKPESQAQAPFQCLTFEYVHNVKMDILFVQDATGSQQPYINAAKNQVVQIAAEIRKSGGFVNDDDLRFGVISFRDHPPQDTSYVTKTHGGFSSDIAELQSNFASIVSTGGGDGPEAQCDALEAALNAAWRKEAAKLVILITDSPPHGVESSGDFWPSGHPEQKDAFATAEEMKDRGIVLNVVACEPVLSQYYDRATAFYKGIVAKTNGAIFALPQWQSSLNATHVRPRNANNSGKAQDGLQMTFEQAYQRVVTGFALKLLDTTRYSAEYKDMVEDQAEMQNRGVDDIVTDLYANIQATGGKHYNFSITMSDPSDSHGKAESEVWKKARSMAEAREELEKLPSSPGPTSRRAAADVNLSEPAIPSIYEQQLITRSNVKDIVSAILRQAK